MAEAILPPPQGAKWQNKPRRLVLCPPFHTHRHRSAINLSMHLNSQLLQHKSVQRSSKLELRRRVVIAYALHLAIPSFALPKANPQAVFPKLLAIPVLKDIHIFLLLVHARQAFTALELSFTDLFRILSFIRHL